MDIPRPHNFFILPSPNHLPTLLWFVFNQVLVICESWQGFSLWVQASSFFVLLIETDTGLLCIGISSIALCRIHRGIRSWGFTESSASEALVTEGRCRYTPKRWPSLSASEVECLGPRSCPSPRHHQRSQPRYFHCLCRPISLTHSRSL
jgi:hypothetical protein